MLVEDVAALYKAFVDESDASWHTSVVTSFLKQGYSAFRRRVSAQQPFIYATSVDIEVSGYSYNLATSTPSIMGSVPTATRMERLLEVRTISTNGSEGARIQIIPSPEQALDTAHSAAWVRGNVLHFNSNASATFRLWYIPESTVNWAQTNSGDNEFIDDLGEYHELIAIYAAEYYGVRDGATPRVQALKRRAEMDLNRFLIYYQSDTLQIASYDG